MLRRVSGFVAVAFIVLSGGFFAGASAGFASTGNVLRAQDALTADEAIARNLQARGGLEKLRAIQTMKQVMHAVSQGAPADITLYSKRPNMQRQEVSVQGQLLVSAFDGQTAWVINPQMGPDPVTMSGMQAEMTKDQSDFDSPLVNYKEKGTTVEMVGAEMTDGVRTYHLKLTPKATTGSTAPAPAENVFLDATTFLEKKVLSEMSMGGMTMKTETDFADYRPVDGITMPFSIKTSSNGVLAVDLTVVSIQFNVKLDDAFFRVPIK